ncbi:membrane-bound lytic murein transglycosylase MltF [Novosphingobium sp. PhB165]|uniref:transporter substrate-binding domain-containing protein n=1 Tax=Novosphingobium sp. PhB165 TaxID=2485105 RepID=UPI0010EDAE26|nr:transporter substrate-binding domain-containing protein [Novosphingobium sp. PhB165]TCM20488.1 membrane-bound lytic murein transglycosylase MltF [Novosphingobium sp. PhB165]
MRMSPSADHVHRNRRPSGRLGMAALILLTLASSCHQKNPGSQSEQGRAQGQGGQAAPDAVPRGELALPAELLPLVDKAFTGDLDEMIKRHIVRVGVTYNRTFYFIDNGQQRGLSYEYITLLEDKLNKQFGTPGGSKIHVIPIPMQRDMLLPALHDGKVDLVIGQLTTTPERQKLVDFTDPTRRNVNELLITAPGTPPVHSLEDLSGRQVFVRKSSSYFNSLEALNARLVAQGKKPVDIKAAPESLEDDDILEMVNAGLVPATVVDDYLAHFWHQVLPKLEIHEDIALRTGGNLAVAVRKGNPQLRTALNGFIAKDGLDSVIGRVLSKRYLQNTQFVTDATSTDQRQKFLNMVDLFRKYGSEYKFDFLLMAAQGYQESHLDNNAKSHVGAIGVMQLMPATGAQQNVGNIHELDPNIHAGVKYMRFMRDRYFQNEPMDDLNKGLFTFASYNAGAGRIRDLRRIAAERGLNPNVWFGNVERVAMEKIGVETPTYVSNIYKYYIAYSLVLDEHNRREAAKKQLEKTLH